MAKTLIGDKEFQLIASDAKLSLPGKKDHIFNFYWNSGAQAAGVIGLSNANTLSIGFNFDILIKRITVTCVRRSVAGVNQASGSIELTISANLNIGENLNLTSIGAQWGALPSFIHCFTPGGSQLELDGFKVLGGTVINLNLKSFNFGATILNDEILAYFTIQY